MTQFNCVNLEKLVEDFSRLEEEFSELKGKQNMLEIMIEDNSRLMKFYMTKEKGLIEEKDILLATVNRLQQTLQEQCNLIVENDNLKNSMIEVKQQNEREIQDSKAELQRLFGKMKVQEENHKRELETVREQCRRQVEDIHRERISKLEDKDAAVKHLLEEKDLDLEEMKKREREGQIELLKLQMEFGAKLARAERTAQLNQQQQQQQHGSRLVPHSVFKKKLQFVEDEKNKEIAALRHRIKELEDSQRVCSLNDSCLKKKKI